jgi:hypothetical protein
MNAEAKGLPRAPHERVHQITIHTDSRDIARTAISDGKSIGGQKMDVMPL